MSPDPSRGEKLVILIDAENPKRSAVNFEGDTLKPIDVKQLAFWVLPPGMMGGFYAFVIGVIVATYRRERRLLRWGNPVRAKILTRGVQQVKGNKYWSITYSFVLSGSVYRGNRDGLPIDTPEAAFDRAIIFYDPQHPEKNAFYPMKSVQLAGSRS